MVAWGEFATGTRRSGEGVSTYPCRRQLPPGITPDGGSAHFLISRGAGEYLFEFLARRPDVLRFYRHTWMPTEMLFATLLRNAPFAAGDVIDENLWFIAWPPGDVKHPNVLGRCASAPGGPQGASQMWRGRLVRSC